MRRGAAWGVGAGGLLAIAAVVWWSQPRPDRPRPAEPGAPLPLGERVERTFVDETTGEREVWTLEKRITTREEAAPEAALPRPDPAAGGDGPDESARALDAMAIDAWRSGDIAAALELFERAVAADPDDRVPRSHYGRLLTQMAEYGRARPQLERAAQLAPEDPQVWLDLLTLYERTQRLALAWETRERVRELAGDRPIVQDELGRYRLEGDASSIP